ncbi:MAG: sugar phosphate isomerase/epimerase [Neomegalonema sp.]|nr:sugar phosphate isomerase/epimerase [Neomegalonema sp.]
MARELGCCTWIFGGAPLTEIAERVARAGLNGVELFGDVETVDPDEALRIFQDKGLKIFSITPGDADISHPDPAVRAPALAYYERLTDWASALGEPLISCHGLVQRIRPIASQEEEDALLADAVQQVCDFAARRGLNVVFEILNRYESHQVRTVSEGLALLNRLSAGNLGLLPDAYHMNIEEADPAQALRDAGDKLGLYHAADSNRGAVGDGHTDFAAQIEALNAVNYTGPVILEMNAPGPNPFTPDKGSGFREIVESQLARSADRLRALGA